MCAPDRETDSMSVPSLEIDEEKPRPGVMYKYRDFSRVPSEKQEGPEHGVDMRKGTLESSIRMQKFPVKLYAILGKKEFNDIITWMPHGRCWKVLKPGLFESVVMPLFFEYSNYHSFNRLVNAWSFRRISSGPDRGSYYHELFLRGKPHLQTYMRRLPKTHKKLPMNKDDEPDFYVMDRENPLPPHEEQAMSNSASPVPSKVLATPDFSSSLPSLSATEFSLVSPENVLSRDGGDQHIQGATFPSLQFLRHNAGLNLPSTNLVRSIQLLKNIQTIQKLNQLKALERQLVGSDGAAALALLTRSRTC